MTSPETTDLSQTKEEYSDEGPLDVEKERDNVNSLLDLDFLLEVDPPGSRSRSGSTVSSSRCATSST
ncbi:hypothetical protein ACFZA9_03090 [Streptomyces olivaceus]|uniref:hypothetical protein n=1 Tax=Streptomyces olivaceus TaxID=47716 RepID=UPI0036E56404